MVRAADGVNLEIQKGEVLGLVGESGCGKSVTALSIMYLIPSPPGRIASGEIWFQGVNLLAGIQKEAYLRKGFRGKAKIVQNQGLLRKHRARMSKIRGREMSMIFQEPMSSLNPVLSIGYQIAEILIYQRRQEICNRLLSHHQLNDQDLELFREAVSNPDATERGRVLADFCLQTSLPVERVTTIIDRSGLSFDERVERVRRLEEEARRRVLDLLKTVRIPEPHKVFQEFPHELSGGMQQRAMIAMALACDPALMIADEPTTSLDVTTQAQILKLLQDLRKRINSAILYITHDLAVIAELCDRVAVMYAAQIVEDAPVADLFAQPLHPYTQGLLESIVSLDKEVAAGAPLPTIAGTVPDLTNPPSGCRFHPRCKYAFDRCKSEEPKLIPQGANRRVACFLYDGGEAHAGA